ncbi:LysM peptidoglycan-binding domain-containing protein [Dehalobacterium formicoaceticum]|uniref:LysM peptidoglycan-binding domain-containing protein n=1 Tax=Dehalobacterium formicoaceticum TaxID=51515 RepID=UPI0031F66581
MVKDVFAPVVKTLFIPEGNPGVQEIKEIRAVPRMTQAEGDDQEITISGEMDLKIRYLPIDDMDEDIPWRSIQLTENETWSAAENEEQVIARLKSALKDEEEETVQERLKDDETRELEICVPFTLAIDTEGLCRDHPMTMNPSVHSSNWFLVNPKAIEYEAVLQLITEENAEPVFRAEEPIPLDEEFREASNTEPISAAEEYREIPSTKSILLEEEYREIPSTEPILLEEESREISSAEPILLEEESGEVPKAEPILTEEVYYEAENYRTEENEEIPELYAQTNDWEEIPTETASKDSFSEREIPQFREVVPLENQVPLPLPQKLIKVAAKEKEVRSESSGRQSYFQMKFYRVQAGEDLDAIADKFGISRERISTFNAIHEEEIRTGLLLSIPGS